MNAKETGERVWLGLEYLDCKMDSHIHEGREMSQDRFSVTGPSPNLQLTLSMSDKLTRDPVTYMLLNLYIIFNFFQDTAPRSNIVLKI